MLINAITQPINHVATVQHIKSCRYRMWALADVYNIQHDNNLGHKKGFKKKTSVRGSSADKKCIADEKDERRMVWADINAVVI